MHGYWFDYAAALLAGISAYYWALSAKIEFPFGFDMDAELREAMKKAAKFNSKAAGFAAVAAAVTAVKTFGTIVHLVMP